MKTALIFCGFFRTFDYVKDTLKENIINPLDCDIFFASPKTVFAKPENEAPEMHHKYSQNTNEIDVGWFGDRLKSHIFIDHNLQTYKNIINNNNIPEKNQVNQYTARILSYMHSISLSMSLFRDYVEKNNIKYDLVILTRADIKYYRKFDPNVIDFSKINFALHSMNEGRFNTCEGCPPSFNKPFNDQLVVGTQNNMLVYSNIYDKVIDYYTKENISFISETFWGVHSARNGVDCVGTDFILYELWRDCKF